LSWLLYLISLAIFGLIVGAFARLALPGKDPLSLPQTMLLGLAGSFIGGVVVYVITGWALLRSRLVRVARVRDADPLLHPAPARRRADQPRAPRPPKVGDR